LRAYGYDLLHVARWLHRRRHPLAKINQSILSTMSVTNSISCPSPRPPPSITVSAYCTVSIASITDAPSTTLLPSERMTAAVPHGWDGELISQLDPENLPGTDRRRTVTNI
jgi:hypothetical protein